MEINKSMATEKFGARGEWWVIAQIVLIFVALVADFVFRDNLPSTGVLRLVMTALSVLCVIAGVVLLAGGIFRLGSNLTAVPRPLDNGHLVQSGAYAIVRHPIYSGIIIGMFGVAFYYSNWIGLLFAVAVLIFFDLKSRREEAWLVEKYPEYPAYRTRVHKLIPFIY
jgi:protein-S-isoprenylcysteine O-methyltransferase Ste14